MSLQLLPLPLNIFKQQQLLQLQQQQLQQLVLLFTQHYNIYNTVTRQEESKKPGKYSIKSNSNVICRTIISGC